MASGYALLDSGGRRRLERFGDVVLDRPAPQALWEPSLSKREWDAAHGRYERDSSGGGSWTRTDGLPEQWELEAGGLRLLLRPTGFGHLGIFPEQIRFWEWIQQRCKAAPEPPRVLNLFGYTGGSTLAAALGGAKPTHCDASKGVVQWGRQNQSLSAIGPDAIRWIVDDARKFVRRELRREKRYDAVILDPPSFGRGQKGEVFKLERDLPSLLADLAQLLGDAPQFMLLSAHTPGVGPLALERLLRQALRRDDGLWSAGEMFIDENDDPSRRLPSGEWCAWQFAGDPP